MKVRKSDQQKFNQAYTMIVQENYLRQGNIQELSQSLHISEKRLLHWFSLMLKHMALHTHSCPHCGAVQPASTIQPEPHSF